MTTGPSPSSSPVLRLAPSAQAHSRRVVEVGHVTESRVSVPLIGFTHIAMSGRPVRRTGCGRDSANWTVRPVTAPSPQRDPVAGSRVARAVGGGAAHRRVAP